MSQKNHYPFIIKLYKKLKLERKLFILLWWLIKLNLTKLNNWWGNQFYVCCNECALWCHLQKERKTSTVVFFTIFEPKNNYPFIIKLYKKLKLERKLFILLWWLIKLNLTKLNNWWGNQFYVCCNKCALWWHRKKRKIKITSTEVFFLQFMSQKTIILL